MSTPNRQLPLLNADISEKSFVYHGDALRVLAHLPSDSCQTAVTSPPYWGLRDYDTDGQIGSEDSVDEYVVKFGITLFQNWACKERTP
jgi:DNA modification methylase